MGYNQSQSEAAKASRAFYGLAEQLADQSIQRGVNSPRENAGFRKARTPAQSLRDINLSIVVLLFLLSPEFPWYLLLAVPFLSIASTLPGWALTVGGFMLYDVVPGDPQPSYDGRSAILAALVAAALLTQVALSRRSGAQR